MTREAIRKNHYKHMHSKQKQVTPKKEIAGTDLDPSFQSRQENQTAQVSSRKFDVQSEMRIRSNEKAVSAARKILSSDHYIRKQEY